MVLLALFLAFSRRFSILGICAAVAAALMAWVIAFNCHCKVFRIATKNGSGPDHLTQVAATDWRLFVAIFTAFQHCLTGAMILAVTASDRLVVYK